MKAAFKIFFVLFVLTSLYSYAEKIANPNRVYNPKTTQTLEGTIEKIDYVTQLGQKGWGIHLILLTEGEELSVHLGPQWYLNEQHLYLASGDSIRVKGSRITINHKPTIIASMIQKEHQSVQLRDEYGIPRWRNKQRGHVVKNVSPE